MADGRCKFCGDPLYMDREGWWRSSAKATGSGYGTTSCTNRAGRPTLHHPDAPEWNGGVTCRLPDAS